MYATIHEPSNRIWRRSLALFISLTSNLGSKLGRNESRFLQQEINFNGCNMSVGVIIRLKFSKFEMHVTQEIQSPLFTTSTT